MIKLVTFTFLIILASAYTTAVYTNGTATVAPASALAKKGQLIYQQKNCVACHQFYGLGGYMGPDLTNVMSAKGKGELYARALLQYGSAKMPNFKLNNNEIDALISFMKHIDESGKFPLIKPEITTWGDVQVEKYNSKKMN